MKDCIEHGIKTEGVLPGPLLKLLVVRHHFIVSWRRNSGRLAHDPMYVIDWVNMFALAVNEENAAGGRVDCTN